MLAIKTDGVIKKENTPFLTLTMHTYICIYICVCVRLNTQSMGTFPALRCVVLRRVASRCVACPVADSAHCINHIIKPINFVCSAKMKSAHKRAERERKREREGGATKKRQQRKLQREELQETRASFSSRSQFKCMVMLQISQPTINFNYIHYQSQSSTMINHKFYHCTFYCI